MKSCAYCGKFVTNSQRDHVFPKCLYPPSKAKSRSQRLTVPACDKCNQSWADDEAHFRNVCVMSGDNPNLARTELLLDPMVRSFDEVDSERRIFDLLNLMKPVDTESGRRYKISPVKDPRVLRIVRKIIRGLCYHHNLQPPISEKRIWVSVPRKEIPVEYIQKMNYHHREEDIVEYRYSYLDTDLGHSIWLLIFFEKLKFIGAVSTSENGFSPDITG